MLRRLLSRGPLGASSALVAAQSAPTFAQSTNAPLFNLDGKVALVTGSSRGIGFAIACGLAEHGATVVMAGTNPTTLAEARRHASMAYTISRETHGPTHLHVALDALAIGNLSIIQEDLHSAEWWLAASLQILHATLGAQSWPLPAIILTVETRLARTLSRAGKLRAAAEHLSVVADDALETARRLCAACLSADEDIAENPPHCDVADESLLAPIVNSDGADRRRQLRQAASKAQTSWLEVSSLRCRGGTDDGALLPSLEKAFASAALFHHSLARDLAEVRLSLPTRPAALPGTIV